MINPATSRLHVIYQIIKQHGPISRREIAEKLNEIKFQDCIGWTGEDANSSIKSLERTGNITKKQMWPKVMYRRSGMCAFYSAIKRDEE